MSIIKCTSSTIHYAPIIDQELPAIGEILITVGQKYLATIPDQDSSEWLSFGEVAGLCRRYHYALAFRNYRARELQPEILALFDGRDSIQRNGVKVRYQSRQIHPNHARVPKTVHNLKFYRLCPNIQTPTTPT